MCLWVLEGLSQSQGTLTPQDISVIQTEYLASIWSFLARKKKIFMFLPPNEKSLARAQVFANI